MKTKRKTADQIDTAYEKAKELIASGISMSKACESEGISHTQYYDRRRKDNLKVHIYKADTVARKTRQTRKPATGNVFIVGPMTIEQAREILWRG